MTTQKASLSQMLIKGFVGGALATAPMTVSMLAMQWLLPKKVQAENLPPQDITETAVETVNEATPLTLPEKPVKQREGEFSAPTLAAHFSYGGATGALYLPLTQHLPPSPFRRGALFGLGIWTVSYLGFLPAAGLYPFATRRPAELNILMILAHVVWGGSLAWLCNDRPNRATA
jgi:putative membrane protein